MKKEMLSLVTVLALSGSVFAGGDIAPIVAPVVVEEDNSAFYLGLGLGQLSLNDNTTSEEISYTAVMLQAGYQYNEYIAVEGRYTYAFNKDYNIGNTNNLESDFNDNASAWGIYLKPMYPIGDFSIYALLGYGGLLIDSLAQGDAYESGFQWGLGAQYAITENFLVFADYVKLYDDTGFDYRAQLDDVDADTWTLGVSYKF